MAIPGLAPALGHALLDVAGQAHRLSRLQGGACQQAVAVGVLEVVDEQAQQVGAAQRAVFVGHAQQAVAAQAGQPVLQVLRMAQQHGAAGRAAGFGLGVEQGAQGVVLGLRLQVTGIQQHVVAGAGGGQRRLGLGKVVEGQQFQGQRTWLGLLAQVGFGLAGDLAVQALQLGVGPMLAGVRGLMPQPVVEPVEHGADVGP